MIFNWNRKIKDSLNFVNKNESEKKVIPNINFKPFGFDFNVLPRNRKAMKVNFAAKSATHFEDIIGLDEVKEECFQLIKFLKQPKKFKKMGATLPKGLLLVGETGTGKTLLARAIAREAGVPFISTSGSDFIQIQTGIGAYRIKSLFAKANLNSPCILFIDEIDSIARKRSAFSSECEEFDRSLDQLLIEMDGFNSNDNVIVIGTTNNLNLLDPSVLRSGRFDSIININLPNHKDRVNILKYYIVKKKLTKKVDLDDIQLKHIVQFTEGFTGADLESLVNEANFLIVKTGIKKIRINTLNDIITNMIRGAKIPPLKNSKLIYKHAYYEIGRGLTANILTGHKNIQNVVLASRENENSSIELRSSNSSILKKESHFISQIIGLFGGHISKKVAFGLNETTIALNDDFIKIVNKILETYDTLGFYESGPINLASITSTSDDPIFYNFLSKSTENDIEIFNILNFCYSVATLLINNNRLLIDILVDEFVVVKTLNSSNFLKFLS
jgi:cell division protease FtsH